MRQQLTSTGIYTAYNLPERGKFMWLHRLVAACAILVGLTALIQIPVHMNDLRIEAMAAEMINIPLPPETKYIGDVKTYGGSAPTRGGTWCGLVAKQRYWTYLSAEEVRQYYAGHEVAVYKPFSWQSTDPIPVHADIEEEVIGRTYYSLVISIPMPLKIDHRCILRRR